MTFEEWRDAAKERDELREQITSRDAELRRINLALNDDRVDLTITAAEAITELRQELDEARRTAEYWKACHLAGNEELAECQAALVLKDEALMRLAEHDSRCEVFDLDDNDRHKQCSCGLDASLSAKPVTEALEKWLGEPVAWLRDDDKGGSINTMSDCCTDVVKQLWRLANPKQVARYTIPLYAPKGMK